MTANNQKSTRASALMWRLLAMATIPMADGIAKYLTESYPLTQIAWARFAIHAGCLLPIVVWRYGVKSLWPKRIGMQVMRGGFLFADVMLFLGALAILPLADTLALFFISPLVVTILSIPFLGEHVGVRRLMAAAVGFIGALIIIRPGFAVFDWASLMAIGSGVAYALYMIFTKKLAGAEPSLVTLAHTAIFSAVALTAIMPLFWVAVDWQGAGWMLAMGLLAATSHYFLLLAFERGSASFLASFTYTEMIVAVIIGYIIFQDFPDIWTWVGMVIIAASGIYISWRERT
jgi:drug/metabolite transporter (DMT)-like permease